VAYTTDFTPPHIAELASTYPHLAAVKESSTDVRRVTWLKALLGERLKILVGVDDAIVEGVQAGAVGWVAGLVNAFPVESVTLYNLAVAGHIEEARQLYAWFLPLLRLDTVPKFVQLIKLVQEKVDKGNTRVRPPRLEVVSEELEHTLAIIDAALAERPKITVSA
jgi:4-hydroxy-tetrahydrodipicolinate synthase